MAYLSAASRSISAGQANAGRSAAGKPGTSPAAKPAEPMRVEESTDEVDPLGFGNVSPKSPGELQKTFGSENEGHGATARSGTGPGEGMAWEKNRRHRAAVMAGWVRKVEEAQEAQSPPRRKWRWRWTRWRG